MMQLVHTSFKVCNDTHLVVCMRGRTYTAPRPLFSLHRCSAKIVSHIIFKILRLTNTWHLKFTPVLEKPLTDILAKNQRTKILGNHFTPFYNLSCISEVAETC